tara:strand:+ start:936 stop:1154 length:219 start_codon:yes stop_codon:yes gene_type:complete
MHYDQRHVMKELDGEREEEFKLTAYTHIAVLKLDKGDTAWNPASTKYPIRGPGAVSYALYEDGGIDTTVVSR